jgi:hypothetical protein
MAETSSVRKSKEKAKIGTEITNHAQSGILSVPKRLIFIPKKDDVKLSGI